MINAPNFVLQEFVSKKIFETFGESSIWFIDHRIPAYAQLLKEFFTQYYRIKYGPDKVKTVLIRINNWHTGGSYEYRGFRPRDCNEGTDNGQHRFGRAIDTDIIIVFTDDSTVEADYKEVQKTINDNKGTFMKYGLTAMEDISIASTWLHSDMRFNNNSPDILIVKP